MNRQKRKVNVSEFIILTQSTLLLLLGVAGATSSATITAGYRAMRNLESAVTIITDNAIVTDLETVSVDKVEGIINNFEFMCTVSVIIGLVVAVATAFRIYKKLYV
jgi:hypothetical protein